MTLNLSKHGAEMQAAWKKVCDAKDPTDWALYGYEGRSLNYHKILHYRETNQKRIGNHNNSHYKSCQQVIHSI